MLERKLVSVTLQCAKCARAAALYCSDVDDVALARARATLPSSAWRCPHCDQVHNAENDLLGGKNVRPALTLEDLRSLKLKATTGSWLTRCQGVGGPSSHGPLSRRRRVA